MVTIVATTTCQSTLEAISKLSDRQRECISLREYGGLSYREIAELAGISLNEVRVHLHRGRQNLKRMLEEWL